MAKRDGFKRGSGCYTCACCKRQTRETKHSADAAFIGLCLECYELAGFENVIQDGDELTIGEKEYCRRLLDTIKLKGGDYEAAFAFPEVINYV